MITNFGLMLHPIVASGVYLISTSFVRLPIIFDDVFLLHPDTYFPFLLKYPPSVALVILFAECSYLAY
jgi:hypothetical protein